MPHTPGPWRVKHGGDICSVPGKVAVCCLLKHATGPRRMSDDEVKANARLIESAPDMLDALQQALEVMEEVYIDEAMSGTVSLLKAAIRKATGRDPD